MSWETRITKGAFTSPSGVRIEFDTSSVSRSREKFTVGFNFPDVRGTYVQDNGASGQRFPVTAFFSGPDCDLQATLFEEICGEPGIGILEHPMYGRFDAMPFGVIQRDDDLVSGLNQSVVTLEFFEVLLDTYPIQNTDYRAGINAALSAYNSASAGQLTNVDLSTVSKRGEFLSNFNNAVKSVKSSLRKVADAQVEVQKTFDTIDRSLNEGVEALVGDPATIAFQTLQLIQTPARSAALISDKIKAYSSLMASVINSGYDFLTADLFAAGAHSGVISSALNTQLTRKSEALKLATQILASFDALNTWRETSSDGDTGEVYQSLNYATSITVGYLIQLSFTLKRERIVTITRDRTIVDFMGEVFDDIDANIDFFILSNNLSGSEILELKKGRQVVYYV